MSSSSRPESDGSIRTPGIDQGRTPTVVGAAAPTSSGVPEEPAPSPGGDESEGRPRSAAGTAGNGMRSVIRSLLPQRSLPSAGQPLDPDSPAIWEHDTLGPAAPTTQSERTTGAEHTTGTGGTTGTERTTGSDESTGSDGTTGAGERPEAPGRPTRTVVLAVVCGAALLSVPFLVIGTGGHSGKDHSASKTLEVTDKPDSSGLPALVGPTASSSASSTPRAATSPHHSSAAPSGKPLSGHAPSHVTTTAPRPPKTSTPQGPGIAQVFVGVSHVLLRNVATDQCADLTNVGPGHSGDAVEQWFCRPSPEDNQLWTLKVADGVKGPDGARVFTISNDKDGLCMDLPMFAVEPSGSAVSEYACDSTTADNQLWYLAPVEADHYRFRNLASDGRCLTVSGGSSAGREAKLIIESCQSSAAAWAVTTG